MACNFCTCTDRIFLDLPGPDALWVMLYPSTYVGPPYPESREVVHYLAVNVAVSRSAFSLVPATECCREYYRRGLTHTHTHTHIYNYTHTHTHTHHNTSTLLFTCYTYCADLSLNTCLGFSIPRVLLSFGKLSNDGAPVTRHTGLGKKKKRHACPLFWMSNPKKRKQEL